MSGGNVLCPSIVPPVFV